MRRRPHAARLLGALVGLVALFPLPVFADNCDSRSDCWNSILIEILVAVLLALLIALAFVAVVAAVEAAAAAAAEAGAAAAAEEAAAAAAAEEAAAAAAAEEEAAADVQRMEELARDPAQGGKMTPKTMQEARVARGMEKSGALDGPVTRDPTGAADFIDGNGQAWDVKTFNSNFSPSQGGYDLADSMAHIGDELALGENVIVDTTNMTPEAVQELSGAVEQAGWADQVKWWP